MPTQHELQGFQKQLQNALRATAVTLKHLDEGLDFGSDVDHFDEEADEAEEFANRLGVKKSLQERMESIKTALEKIKKGIYGLCEKCGRNIEIEVLHAGPESQLCKKCKAKEK